MIRRYGAPTTSSIVGSHHALFNHVNGLIKHPAAPRHPPTIEIVAARFLRLIYEQTVILLKAITPAARANSRHAMNQRKCDPISTKERATVGFLAVKSARVEANILKDSRRTVGQLANGIWQNQIG